MGYVHQPAYGNDWSWTPWNHKSRLNTLPPITVRQNLLRLGNVSVSGSGDGDFRARGLIEGMMLNGQTVAERTAAARALIGWPPAEYSLRVAEWGVWIDEGGERLTTKGVLEEIPGFVHRTGNSLASLPRNRVELQLIVTKPIIHLTADRPLAVDLEISIAGGRPRYAFPRPDTLTFHSQDAGAEYTPTLTEWDEMEAKQLAGLQGLLEGYPWIHPADRMNDAAKPPFWVDNLRADAVGMRWQSLIVSPQRQTWMSPPAVSADPKFRWWEQLRDVPSAWVTSQGETERFLYYDGPTTARSPLEAVRKEAALKLTARDVFDAPQADSRRFGADRKSCVFIDSQQSPPRGFAISPVDTFGSELSLQFANQTWLRGDEIETTFREMLLEEGLTKEEAAGLLDSWRERFFQAPGQRLLTLLTRSEYDRMCPLKVRPPATETVRVGIVLREF
jgi:hypothetical protein